MTIAHVGAWKIGVWIGGSATVLIVASVAEAQQGLSPIVQVALIMSASSLLVAIITGVVSIYMQRQTGKKVDGILSDAHKGERDATTRADRAEAFTKGSESERAKEKS